MEFISTQGAAPPTQLKDALLTGLAPDGGLFMPAEVPVLSPATLAELAEAGWPAAAQEVGNTFFSGELSQATVETLISGALKFPVPLVRLTERIHVLELFHGPTLAFKDVGMTLPNVSNCTLGEFQVSQRLQHRPAQCSTQDRDFPAWTLPCSLLYVCPRSLRGIRTHNLPLR